ncbi:MAG: bacteriophage abortive infection AbiH family protein [Muribaculaceae bacterium]|nr:bacteriophage abortive infection AbiH family protein [Muribaculaceae bacterium]
MERHLYLIGNGFDLHHGINSGYTDFRNWLEKTNNDLFYQINEIYEVSDKDKWWSDFENRLAMLNAVQLAAHFAYENNPYYLSNHCEFGWDQAAIEVELQLDRLFSELRGYFHEWIAQLNTPLQDKKIQLDIQDTFFINFNYTKTLENLYGVSPKKILHIHGCVDSDDNFILGHGKDYQEIQKMNHVEIPKPTASLSEEEISEYYESFFGTQEHEKLALESAIRGILSQKKPVHDIIRKNIEYFESINDVGIIHVYGLSLSDVDMPYFDYFAKKKRNALWIFSDIQNKNIRRIEWFCKNKNIKKYKIIDLNDILVTMIDS